MLYLTPQNKIPFFFQSEIQFLLRLSIQSDIPGYFSRKFQSREEQNFVQFLENRTSSRVIPKLLQKFLLEIYVPFHFHPRISEIFS